MAGGQQMTDFLTVAEAADNLNTSERFVRRLVEERRIVFHRFGKHLRFARDDIDRFIAAGLVELPPSRWLAS
jgi:excisionase family DNA binding protein